MTTTTRGEDSGYLAMPKLITSDSNNNNKNSTTTTTEKKKGGSMRTFIARPIPSLPARNLISFWEQHREKKDSKEVNQSPKDEGIKSKGWSFIRKNVWQQNIKDNNDPKPKPPPEKIPLETAEGLALSHSELIICALRRSKPAKENGKKLKEDQQIEEARGDEALIPEKSGDGKNDEDAKINDDEQEKEKKIKKHKKKHKKGKKHKKHKKNKKEKEVENEERNAKEEKEGKEKEEEKEEEEEPKIISWDTGVEVIQLEDDKGRKVSFDSQKLSELLASYTMDIIPRVPKPSTPKAAQKKAKKEKKKGKGKEKEKEKLSEEDKDEEEQDKKEEEIEEEEKDVEEVIEEEEKEVERGLGAEFLKAMNTIIAVSVPKDPAQLSTSEHQKKRDARLAELKGTFSYFVPHDELIFSGYGHIGRGNYGSVELAKFRGGLVAVKKLNTNENTLHYRLAKREAEMLQRASHHPNVAAFLGVSSDPQDITAQCIIVSEYYKYGSVDKFLLKHPDLEWDKLLYMLQCTAAGMLHLHSQGIIHSDLSLRNLLVDNDGESVRVADFGLAKLMDEEVEPNHNMAPEITAPEAIVGEYSQKADIYSFGTVIWGFCTRGTKAPYRVLRDAYELNTAKLAGHIFLKKLNPGLPRGVTYPRFLESMMKRCWAADPDKRPSFLQLLTEIEEKLLAYKDGIAEFCDILSENEEAAYWAEIMNGGGSADSSTDSSETERSYFDSSSSSSDENEGNEESEESEQIFEENDEGNDDSAMNPEDIRPE